MAESELYMQCEVEDLDPCQSNSNDKNQMVNPNNAQAEKLDTTQTVSPETPRAAPEISTVLPIPVTFTCSPLKVRSSIAATSNVTNAVPVSPFSILCYPAIAGTTTSLSTPTAPLPASVGQQQSPSPLMQHVTETFHDPKPQIQNSTHATAATEVYQTAVKIPQFCSLCGASYTAVQALRGYLCQCNSELIKSIDAMTARSKKKKLKHSSGQMRYKPYSQKDNASPSSSFTFESHRPATVSPSHSSSLKYISTSAIPEGAPVPGTGDYDKHGKLIMLVEDFYYGRDPVHHMQTKTEQVTIMKCLLCDKKLKNNIKLMNHMKHHMEIEYQSNDMDSHAKCQHCFRNYDSPFSLQCHVETVHSHVEYPSLCKICELSFEDTPIFLNHMKNSHKPGEMPYMCQVCKFRSSFYEDVIGHFRKVHKNTIMFLCHYCLEVFKSSNKYQLHYSMHQKKSVFCNKCRLQFLYAKDKSEHQAEYHQTHLKPVQLLGLKPGTKITVRAYAVTKISVQTICNKLSMDGESSPVKKRPPVPALSRLAPSIPEPVSSDQKITLPKRKPVESMLELMTKFQSHCEQTRKYLCIECNFQIPDFSSHFPTFVHCSLCHYSTCCSRAYANHMISNHVARKTTTKYLNLYKSCPKFGKLSCFSCEYTTEVGDSMAKHLAKHPGHRFKLCKLKDGFSSGYRRFVFIPADLIRRSRGVGARIIVPVQVLRTSVHQPTQLVRLPPKSIFLSNHLVTQNNNNQPVDQSTAPVKKYGTESKDTALQNKANTWAEPTVGGSLTLAQLKMVLYALCFGIPHAANQFDTQPDEIHSLLLKHQLQFGSPKTIKKSISQGGDRLHEWVLCQREQQLPVDEAIFFSKASEFMSTESGESISYEWAVNFLLNRNLSLPLMATSRRLLPHKAQERLQSFSCFINKQVTSQGFGLSAIGAMDEFSIFIDMEQLDPASADSASMLSAFKMVGGMDLVMDVVLATLADGTMLPTMVFLKGEPLSTDPPALPENIIIKAKPEGFTDEERLQLWFNVVWCQHVKPSSGGKGLLIMDSYRGHLANNFLALLNSANTMPSIIPQSCSSHLQPLEACVAVVLRELLQLRWSQHVTEAPQDLIGAEPAKLAILFSAWLLEMLDVLAAKPELVRLSFEPVLSSTSESTSAEFSKLVRHLTDAIVHDPLQEQESMEAADEEKGAT